jgi:hypothetical protein
MNMQPYGRTETQLGYSETYEVTLPSCTVEHHAYLEAELETYRRAIARIERFFATMPGLMEAFEAFEHASTADG